MVIPTTKTVTLCDAERFCEGLKQLAIECNMDSLVYDKIGIISYNFKDGSHVGATRAWKEAGIIEEK